jgi:hypothetical protein
VVNGGIVFIAAEYERPVKAMSPESEFALLGNPDREALRIVTR